MKLKKGVKVFFLILFIAILSIILIPKFINKHIEKNTEENKSFNVINELYSKINKEEISIDFLNWLSKNYSNDALIKINELISTNGYNETVWYQTTNKSLIVLKDLYNNTYKDMDNVKVIDTKNDYVTLSFVGDVSLADDWKIMPKYDERDKGVKGILSDSILEIMTSTDVMVANNEFTVSNRGSKISKAFNFRAKPERLKIYDEMGVDLVTLANNHSYDYGEVAFLDMLDSLKEYNIPFIGAGKNIDEAKKPFYFIVNGKKFAFVNATRAEKNIVTPGASENKSGVFRCYDSTNMINLIKEVKQNSDYVIALIHFGKEGYHDLEEEQIKSSKMYIDAGADAVVGSHAHMLQGIEFYNDKIIMYNLGDFIFNAKNEETGIFQMKINKDNTINYYFYSALQNDCYTDILEGSEKEKLVKDMNSWSINAYINESDEIIKKD